MKKKYKYNKEEQKIYYESSPILKVEQYINNEEEFIKSLLELMNSPSACLKEIEI